MADSSLKVVHKLKDSQNRPVFLPGYEGLGGAMDDLAAGLTWCRSTRDVAAMAANAKSILFGDFNQYVVRDVMAPTLFRFEDPPTPSLARSASPCGTAPAATC